MKVYTVIINGLPHTVQLSDADAKAQGLTAEEPMAPEPKAARKPANKSRSAKNKSA